MDVQKTVRSTRPAVHQICAGAFVQERLNLGAAIWAIPLRPLGFMSEAAVTAQYAREIGAVVDQGALDNLISQGANSRPLVALVRHCAVDVDPALLEEAASEDLRIARHVIAWSSGETPEPIAMVTARKSETYFRMIPPTSRNRQRLGLGNERERHEPVMQRLFKAMAEDQRFSFAVSIYVDALKADDPEFRVARFYACLESLTYRIRSRHGDKSRAAVRDLIGMPEGAAFSVNAEGQQLTMDRIEVGGRIRDKLIHGVPFNERDLTVEARRAYTYLRTQPAQLRDMLMTDCELEIARWANGTSRRLGDGHQAV